MANQNRPRGFETTVQYTPGQVHKYYKSANVQIGQNDPVIRAAASADPSGRYASVTRHTAGAAVTGFVVGAEDLSGIPVKYLPAAQAGYLLVVDDPNVELKVQADNAAVLGADDCGKHINTVAALDCNTTTGISRFQLSSATLGNAGTFVLLRSDNDPNNEPGVGYQNWIVRCALHTEVNASANNITDI